MAFYVVMFHAYNQVLAYQAAHVGPSRLMYLYQNLFGWGGHDCVTVFICISGFSLTIPLAKGGYAALSSQGAMRNYFIRRFLRIAPPYYVAIAAVVLLAIFYPGLSAATGTPWNNAFPILDARSIFAHLLFVHSLDPTLISLISSSFWSIGTEAQLYFWLPLVLVPIAIRKSMAWGVIASLVLSLMLIPIKAFDLACLNYVFTFSVGAFVADQIFNPKAKEQRPGVAIVAIATLLIVANIVIALSTKSHWAARDSIFTPVLGLCLYILAKGGVAGFIVSSIRRLLSRKVMAYLGKISYSLYLVHYVVIGLVHSALILRGSTPHIIVIAVLVGAPILSIAVAILLQMSVEAPSMRFAKRFRDVPPSPKIAERPISV